jgi:hypothetical protein
MIGALSLWALLLLPAVAAAREYGVFNISGISGSLGGLFRQESETNTYGETGRGEERSGYFASETVHLRVEGSIFHPDFWSWVTEGTIGLAQGLLRHVYGEDGARLVERTRTRDWIDDYRLDWLFLRNRPLNIHFYARRQNTVIQRQLSDRFNLEDRIQGSLLRFVLHPWSVDAAYSRRFSRGERLGERVDERLDTTTFRFRNRDLKLGELEGQFSDYDYQERTSDVPRRSQQAFVTLRSTLGGNEADRSLLQFRYRRQKGAGTARLFDLNENVIYGFGKRWRIQSELGLTRETIEEVASLRKVGSAELSWQATRWLRLGLVPRYFDERYDGSLRRDWAAGINALHQREWERMRSSVFASVAYQRTTYDEPGGYRSVQDEPHQFGVDDVVQLQFPHVEEESIVVTDPTGVTLYERGRDYAVSTFGDYTQLVRLMGGLIPPGGAIEVDYRYRTEQFTEYATRLSVLDASVHLTPNLDITYSLVDSRTQVARSSNIDVLGDFLEQAAWSTLRWQLLSLRLELRDRRAGQRSTRSWSTTLSLNSRDRWKILLFMDAGVRYRYYTREETTGRHLFAQLRLVHQFSKRSSIRATAYARDYQLGEERNRGWEGEGEFDWRLRSLFLVFRTRYRDIWENEVHNVERIAEVTLRRRF